MDKRIFLMGLTAAAIMPAYAQAAPATLRGTVIYRERMLLPPQARVEVRLVDVSRADAPSITLARTVVPARGGVIPFTLRYNHARIKPGMRYALQARITMGKTLLFITTDHHPAFETPTPQILVKRVRGDAPAQPGAGTPEGEWLAEDIRGRGVIDRLQTVLRIGADGRISGSGGCNRIMGKATINGSAITFGPIASTRMACVPAAMDQEQKFITALSEVRFWRVDAPRRKLILLNEQRNGLIVFAQM